MDVVFKKYFWVIKAFGIAVVVAFFASAVATFLGSSLVLKADAADAKIDLAPKAEEEDPDEQRKQGLGLSTLSSSASSSNGAADKSKIVADIVEKNPFCPTCKPLPEVVDTGAGGPVSSGLRKSTLPLALLATMESDDPLLSRATIADGDKGSTRLYVVEDEVRPGLKLESVERGRAILSGRTGREYIELGGEMPAPKVAQAAQIKVDPKKEKPKGKNVIEGADEAIDCSQENNCVVNREFVEKILEDPAALAKQARVRPGKDGFKFYGVRKGSLPDLLGLKNGDLLKTVNGTDLKSIDDAMGLYTKLRRASNLSVTLERRGKTIQKEIEIK